LLDKCKSESGLGIYSFTDEDLLVKKIELFYKYPEQKEFLKNQLNLTEGDVKKMMG